MFEKIIAILDDIDDNGFEGVSATVEPVPGKDYRYTVTIRNDTAETLVNGNTTIGDLLHPRSFGLDDTHMPSGFWPFPPVRFDTLAPGESFTLEIEGYNVPSRYDGDKNTWARLFVTRIRDGVVVADNEMFWIKVQMAW